MWLWQIRTSLPQLSLGGVLEQRDFGGHDLGTLEALDPDFNRLCVLELVRN